MFAIIRLSLLAAAALSSLALAGDLPAGPATTTVTVPGMDCGGCAKKVAAALAKVRGVAKAEPNLEAKTLRVTPRAGAAPSPRAMWEAVERAGKLPTRLEGPAGTFTSKPKQ